MKKSTELLLILLLFIIVIGVRIYNLDADPPTGLSMTADVYTDPPNLTLHARQNVMDKDVQLPANAAYTLFDKSSISPIAQFFFSIAGISRTTSNAIGLFFSLGGLFLFFLVTRKTAGQLAGIFYLVIISLNYNQLFYGRMVFQEHAMIFWAFLAIVLLLYSDNKYISLLAGISLGACIFFGKAIGIAFIIPFAAYFLYEIYYQKISHTKRKGIYFLAGFLFLTLLWGYFVYLPMLTQVQSYLGEQVSENHGFPVALESISKFIGMYITFGHSSHLISRMVIVCLIAAVYIVTIVNVIITGPKNKDSKSNINSIHIFLVTMMISFYLFLMVWQYRPLRYQLELIYPLCAVTAIYLSHVWESKLSLISRNKITWKLYILLIPVAVLFVSYIMYAFSETFARLFNYETRQMIIVGGMVILSWLIFVTVKGSIKWNSPFKKIISKILIVLIVGTICIQNGYRYFNWAKRPTFTVRDNSVDLKNILNENAVLTGSYATPLTIETDYSAIIHMFGVSNPDPDFFKKNPVTHLLVDADNNRRAKTDYPDIMEKAHYILSYYIGYTKIDLFRIAGSTGNAIADIYELSEFEQMVQANDNGNDSLFTILSDRFLKSHPDNISAHFLIAMNAYQKNKYQVIEESLIRSLEFSPTNYSLMTIVAKYFADSYKMTNNPEYKQKALMYYDKALWFLPDSKRLLEEQKSLEKM